MFPYPGCESLGFSGAIGIITPKAVKLHQNPATSPDA